ncbi:MAG: PQQ-binding-like beta-propeller repeat protein [Gammaproteobacteria bacterium]
MSRFRQTLVNTEKNTVLSCALLISALLICTSVATAAEKSSVVNVVGEQIYNENCASCHDQPEDTLAPTRAAMGAMTSSKIIESLTFGKMQAQGSLLTEQDRDQLIKFLVSDNVAPADNDWVSKMMCRKDTPNLDLSRAATISTFGYNKHNTRALNSTEAGLTKDQLSNMELAWAIAIPNGALMRTQPAITDNTVFLPIVADSKSAMYAFDVSKPLQPCIKWIYRTPGGATLRTSATYGVIADGRGVVAFSGFDTTVYVLDAKTGQPVWTKKVGTYSRSITTGTPVVLRDRILVPVSQFEVSVAAANTELCCNNHGYLLSLDPKDGGQQWRYDTMPDAKPIRDRGDGQMLYGPSGAPIWTSPAVDEKRGLIYIGTGQAHSPPAHKNTNAMIAIGLTDGKEKWSVQATDRDIYLTGCGPRPKPDQYNCVSDTVYRDVDFGASMVLGFLNTGEEMMFAGQKSGTVWALNPATGRVIWRTPLGTGGPMGGVHWGLAYHRNVVYAPISLTGSNLPGEPVDTNLIKPGLYALNAEDGSVIWNFATTANCGGARATRVPTCDKYFGISAAPTIIDGAIVAGSLDGYLYVLDAVDGRLLWKFDTAIQYEGINGVKGNGGTIDGGAIAAVNGLLVVSSGYGRIMPGNVFLAFKPKSP